MSYRLLFPGCDNKAKVRFPLSMERTTNKPSRRQLGIRRVAVIDAQDGRSRYLTYLTLHFPKVCGRWREAPILGEQRWKTERDFCGSGEQSLRSLGPVNSGTRSASKSTRPQEARLRPYEAWHCIHFDNTEMPCSWRMGTPSGRT